MATKSLQKTIFALKSSFLDKGIFFLHFKDVAFFHYVGDNINHRDKTLNKGAKKNGKD